MRDLIREQCVSSFPRFVERVANIPWQERAILLSEAFAFCAICDLCDIDVIFESGIYLGRSTEIWANYFPDKPIFAIDRTLREEPRERLRKYSNLTLMEGEGLVVLEQLLAKFKFQKIGIFVDGPKGNAVVRFGLELLKQENIRFFSLHDVHKKKNEQIKKVRIFFESLDVPTFFTDEKWFLDAYSELDKNESRWDKMQGRRWTPFQYVSGDGVPKRILGSYGPTIGFAFNPKGLT